MYTTNACPFPQHFARSQFQYQPTRTFHDPNPPITLESAAGALFFQSFAETLGTPGLTETLTLLRKKVFTETTVLSETLGRRVRVFFAETAALAELFTKKMFRAFAETTSFTEAIVKKVKKPTVETTSLSETLTTVVTPASSGGVVEACRRLFGQGRPGPGPGPGL